MRRNRRRRGRPVSGVLLLDKAAGISSNDALQEVKRVYRAAKAGHTGSLDVPATGLLPICLGEATKLSGFLLDAPKRYWAQFRLGVTTTTGDAAGEERERRPVPPLSAEDVAAVLARFEGTIEQVPPMYSAVKHEGRRLYELAYRGEVVERAPRPVTIYQFRLLSFEGDRLEVEIHCSKGTYVRTLAEDVGEALGCGAHVGALRRTAVGPFMVEDAWTLDEIAARAGEGLEALDALLLPPESAVAHEPRVVLTEDAAFYLGQGQPVLVPRAPSRGWVRLYAPGERFLGVGEVQDDGRIAPRRLLRPAA